MRRNPRRNLNETRVIGAKPAKVTKKVTAEIVRGLHQQLSQNGRSIAVKAMRFLPSSVTLTGDGSFQVVANALIEVLHDKSAPPSLETMDSVVTVGRAGGAQTLENLTIPALNRNIA